MEARRTVANPSGRPDDTLTLKVNGAGYQGWESVRVTRGIERMPSDFALEVTETYPGQATAAVAKPGDACEIFLGADRVLCGYIDRYNPRLDPASHTVSLSGRSKCQDLIDCSAMPDRMTLTGSSVLDVARDLVRPFAGITVVPLSGEGSGLTFTINVNLGETPFQIIETLGRYEGLLAYDDSDGNLVLSQVGSTRMASGFSQGVNIQAASMMFSMDERFSEYHCAVMSYQKFSDVGDGGNNLRTIYDRSVPRYRPRVIVSEQQQNGTPLAELRAAWELARRRGRSQAISLTCDSWRDSAGRLWEPNALAPVHVPALKVVNQVWCISEVTYERSSSAGTTAQVALMPPEAFTPEPPELQTIQLQVAQALNAPPPASPTAPPSGRRDRQ